MDTTSWLQLIIGVETALTIGVVIGVVVGVRLAAAVHSFAQDTHTAGAA